MSEDKKWVPGSLNYADLTAREKAVWDAKSDDGRKEPGPELVSRRVGGTQDRPEYLVSLKDSNPKDVAGSARVDLSLVPVTAIAEEALAFEEGRTKYGAYNYTVVGVKARVYVSAALRHIFKWLLGEERDQKTGIHHLGSARACLGILLDAQARGKLSDDRPPSQRGASDMLDGMEARVRKVREVFKDFRPRHYTIEDTEHVKGTGEQIHRERAPAAGQEEGPRREDAQPVPGRDR